MIEHDINNYWDFLSVAIDKALNLYHCHSIETEKNIHCQHGL